MLAPSCVGPIVAPRPTHTDATHLPNRIVDVGNCKDGCLNGGRCIGDDRCACVYGYTGRRCEKDYRTGPCYRKLRQSSCSDQLPGVVCTRQLCCATVGVAWGHPCETCPRQLDCDKGYISNTFSHGCQDINECEAIPGLCDTGNCVNTPGSYYCQCNEGYKKNDRTGKCDDVNECLHDVDVCNGGQCVNTDGSYHCICDTGTVPSHDRKTCLGKLYEIRRH